MWFHIEMYFCIVTDVSPYIIDEENGIVYSPSMKRSESMAQRLKEMREKRENLSPTGMFYVSMAYCLMCLVCLAPAKHGPESVKELRYVATLVNDFSQLHRCNLGYHLSSSLLLGIHHPALFCNNCVSTWT